MKLAYILTLFLTFSSLAIADTFTVASYAWKPFTDTLRDDEGISINLVRQALKTQGHDITVVPASWARAMALFADREIDILPAIWFSSEREKTMLFSKSYVSNRLVFIKALNDDYEFEGLSSLYSKRIGIVREYNYGEDFLNDENIHFSVSNSLNSNVKKVLGGRVDLTIEDEIVAKTTIDPELLEQVEFTQNALSEIPLYMSCSKNNPKCEAIITAFEAGLALLKQNGTFDQLFSR